MGTLYVFPLFQPRGKQLEQQSELNIELLECAGLLQNLYRAADANHEPIVVFRSDYDLPTFIVPMKKNPLDRRFFGGSTPPDQRLTHLVALPSASN
jgi:hypothetical protein